MRLLTHLLVSMTLCYVTSLTFILSGLPVPPASQATIVTAAKPDSARKAASESSVAGDSQNCATSPNASQRDVRAANRHLAGIDEH